MSILEDSARRGETVQGRCLHPGVARETQGIGPQGIGAVGMLLNFVVTLMLTPFTRPPSDAVREMIDTIHEPEGAGPAVVIEAAPEH